MNWKRSAFLLLMSGWVLPAMAAPSDILTDDFGEPIQQNDILPPARTPRSLAVPKPVKGTAKKEEAKAKQKSNAADEVQIILVKKTEAPKKVAPPKKQKVAVKKSVPAKKTAGKESQIVILVKKPRVVPPLPSMKKLVPPASDTVVVSKKPDSVSSGAAPDIEVFGGSAEEAETPSVATLAVPKAKAAPKVTILPPAVAKIAAEPAKVTVETKSDKASTPRALVVPTPSSASSSSRSKTVALPPAVTFEESDPNVGAGKGKGDSQMRAIVPPSPQRVVAQPRPLVKAAPALTSTPVSPGKTSLLPTIPAPPVNDDSLGTQLTLEEDQKKDGQPEIKVFGDGDGEGKPSDRVTVIPPANSEDRTVANSGTGFGAEEVEDPADGKKDQPMQGLVPPKPPTIVQLPGGAIMPPAFTPENYADMPAPKDINDRLPVMEHLPVDINAYIDTNRTPKYIRINADAHNIRNTPEFQTGRKDNVYDQNIAGSYYAVSRVVPTEEGVATGIYVDGQEKWVFMPWSKRNEFQYCESEACFSDITMGLDAIARAGQIDTNSLLACGVTGVDGEGRAVRDPRPLPRKIDVASLPPPLRSKPELEALDAKVNRAPSVKVEYDDQSGCVVDTRSRARPNFRNYSGFNERKRAFIAYMTPFALEVQEATGLPAAVVIGQAALESGWGKSGLFTNTKNIFGHSCWREGSTKSLSLDIMGQTKRVSGSCDTPRPTGGYYLGFKNSQDSVYAYAANLLTREHNYYPQVRAAVSRTKPNPADWREVVNGLKNYDGPNPNYRNQVRSIILSNDLQKLETKKLCR